MSQVDESNYKLDDSVTDRQLLFRMARELTQMRGMLAQVIKYMIDAESEIPEKMRRFIMYYHDVHDIVNLYHEIGVEPEDYIKKEMERCHDRYRQLLQDLHLDEGTFGKVRAEMAKDKMNRYDHTRQIAAPKKEGET